MSTLHPLESAPRRGLPPARLLGVLAVAVLATSIVSTPATAQTDDEPAPSGDPPAQEEPDTPDEEAPDDPDTPDEEAPDDPDTPGEPGHGIVEVTCGPGDFHAGRTVRFSVKPPNAVSMYDLCGYAAPQCPPRAVVAPPATGDTGAPGTGDTAGGEADAGPADVPELCRMPWPPGSWYTTTDTDPLTGEVAATGRLVGSWRGPRHWAVAVAPALVTRCAAGRLSITVHTGGPIVAPVGRGVAVAPYGRGVAVAYRLDDAPVAEEEWDELGPAGGEPWGVSLPRWLIDGFLAQFDADLDDLGTNIAGLGSGFVSWFGADPAERFVFRVFAIDGTPLGTASFDADLLAATMAPAVTLCDR